MFPSLNAQSYAVLIKSGYTFLDFNFLLHHIVQRSKQFLLDYPELNLLIKYQLLKFSPSRYDIALVVHSTTFKEPTLPSLLVLRQPPGHLLAGPYRQFQSLLHQFVMRVRNCWLLWKPDSM